MAELVFYRRGEEVLRFPFTAQRVTLGRGEQCDLVIPDPGVSRQHVRLTLKGDSCEMEDLSGKGTAIDGKTVPKGVLSDGMAMELGPLRCLFRPKSSGAEDAVTEAGQRTELVQGGEGKVSNLPMQVRVRTGIKEKIEKLNDEKEAFTVGKDQGNDLQLPHRFVSGRHLRVTRLDNNFFRVSDQQSTNGTWLGGVRLHEADVPFYSTLKVGEAELTIEPKLPTAAKTSSYFGIIGQHISVKNLIEMIDRVGPSSAAVTVLGESGSGKELVARALHVRSPRAERAFIPVNCAAISRELIESELFGHEKGSFTGAQGAHKGAFEEADGGTLFLDEVGELPLDMQAKLLRALESGEIKRVGAARPMNVDVRIVAATNRDLLGMAAAGKFREDLYYRLCVIPLTSPPLRQRGNDVMLLAEHFVKVFSPRNQRVNLTKAAIERLQLHSWPGNIRELRNVVHRALLLRKGLAIEDTDLQFDSVPESRNKSVGLNLDNIPDGLTLEELMTLAERQIIAGVYTRFEGDAGRMAARLGLSRSALYKRLRQYGYEVEP